MTNYLRIRATLLENTATQKNTTISANKLKLIHCNPLRYSGHIWYNIKTENNNLEAHSISCAHRLNKSSERKSYRVPCRLLSSHNFSLSLISASTDAIVTNTNNYFKHSNEHTTRREYNIRVHVNFAPLDHAYTPTTGAFQVGGA